MMVHKLRAWWAHRQGLDGSLAGAAPAEVLARTGWARSVGGSNPYLQVFARAGVGRAALDAAVAELAIHELPSARGCTYVLPASDYPVGLRVGASAPEAEVATCAKLGVPRAELDTLCAAVLDTLDGATEPLTPQELRTELGDRVRDLGAPGKKKGLSSTLPVALGLLQASGELRRIPVAGRLDQQRFRYLRWSPSPLAGAAPTAEEARGQLALRYWSWTGGASLAQFRWFSGLTSVQAKAAVASLELVPLVEVSVDSQSGGDRPGGDLLALPEDAAAFADFDPPREPRYALLGWIDGLTLLRRDLPAVLDPADAARELPAEVAAGSLGGLRDLPAQGIFDRGRLVGLWEYDTAASTIAWTSFVPADDQLRAAVTATERFVRDELGDAKGGSLDSPTKRAPKLAALRQYAAG